MKECLNRIEKIRLFKDNWNGYGAKRIPDKVLDKTIAFLKLMNFQLEPQLTPTGRESIQIEWETKETGYVEIEIYEDYTHVFGCDSEEQVNYRF